MKHDKRMEEKLRKLGEDKYKIESGTKEKLEQNEVEIAQVPDISEYDGPKNEEELEEKKQQIKERYEEAMGDSDKSKQLLSEKMQEELDFAEKELKEFQKQKELLEKFEETKKNLTDEERKKVNEMLGKIKKMAEIIYQEDKEELEKEGLIKTVKRHQGEIDLQDKEINSLQSNAEIENKMWEMIDSSSSETDLFNRFKDLFKDEIADPETDSEKAKDIEQRAMRDIKGRVGVK